MANNLVLENVAVNAEADALAALANSGYLRIKSAADVLLAELRFGATAFAGAVAGLLVANAITGEDSAPAAGVATKYEVYASNGTTLLWTGTVGMVDADCILSNTTIQSGATVNIGSFTHTVPKSA